MAMELNTMTSDSASSVVLETAYALRFELACGMVFFFMMAARHFAGVGAPRRPVAKTTTKRSPESGEVKPKASARRQVGTDGVAPTAKSSALRISSGPASAAQLCDPAWLVPQVSHLCRSNVDRALEMYRSAMKAGLDLKSVSEADCKELYLSLVTAVLRGGHTEDVLVGLFKDIRGSGLSVSTSLLTSTVKLCTSRHIFAGSLSVYDVAVAQDPELQLDDKSVWSCLLFCAIETKSYERCPFLFAKLKEHGTPSSKDYGNMVRYVSLKGDWKGAVAMLSEMEQAKIEVDSVHYNTVLATCVAALELDQAYTLLGRMEEAGGVADVITYNTLMKGYARAGRMDRCFELFEHMRSRDIKASQVTFGILLDGFINDNQTDAAAKVFNTMVSEKLPMNTVLYTTVIKGFSRAGKVDEAMEVYNQMRSSGSGVAPDLVTFSILIKANCDAARLDQALVLLQQMLELKLRPDEVVFNNLLAGCAQQSNVQLGKRLYQDMVASGLRPSNASFSILIRLFAQCKLLDEAVEMLATEPIAHKVELEPRLFVQLIQSCIRERQGRRAVEVYEMMLRSSSKPTAAAHGSMLGTCVKLNMLDTASEIISAAAVAGCRVDARDVESVLDAAVRKKKMQCMQECVDAAEKLRLTLEPKLVAQVRRLSTTGPADAR